MSNSNYKSNKRKFRLKHAVKWIALVLVCVTLSAVVCFGFGGLKFTNPLDKELNSKNLLSYEKYDKDSMLTDTGYGLDVTWKDDGRIVLNGKNGDPDVKENQVKEYTFTSVTLLAGTYNLSGCKNGELNTVGLFVNVPGDQTYYSRTAEGVKFVISEPTTVSIGFYVGNDKTFINKTLSPVLVEGSDAGSFYAA